MNHLSYKHLDFVPAKAVRGFENKDDIYVFTHKRNKRVYKEKNWNIGAVVYNKKTGSWCFISNGTFSLGWETLFALAMFVLDLDTSRLQYDAENGELIDKRRETYEL